MRFYGSDEDKAKYAKSIASEYRAAAALIAPLRVVLNAFNGKVYNKRFIEALREKACVNALYAKKLGEAVLIETSEPRCMSTLTICMIQLDDGKRINAESAMKSAAEYMAKYLKAAADIDECLPKMQEIKSKIAQIEKMYSGITDGIPYQLRDLYGIKKYL